jgi:curved DNA-binding protein CbpA
MRISEAMHVFQVYGVINASALSEQELKLARKRLALIYHPDRFPGGCEHFARINAAYDVLRSAISERGPAFQRYA